MEPSFFLDQDNRCGPRTGGGLYYPVLQYVIYVLAYRPFWCIVSLLGAFLIGGWSPLLMRCCTIPVRPRSAGPDEKISVNSSKRLASSFLCGLLRFMESRSSCSDTSSFVCLGFLVASRLQLAGSKAPSSSWLKVPTEVFW